MQNNLKVNRKTQIEIHVLNVRVCFKMHEQKMKNNILTILFLMIDRYEI